MTKEEKEFIKKVNVDKAKNKTILSILIILISLLTYVAPIIMGTFDFGIIFEITSLVFLLIARNQMSKYNAVQSKRYIICAMASIGWILIYDMINLAFLGYDYFLGELFSVLYIMILFSINRDLSKADNPVKYKESTDWFYEKYEGQENGGNKNV